MKTSDFKVYYKLQQLRQCRVSTSNNRTEWSLNTHTHTHTHTHTQTHLDL
jgi:hypothetical protein